MFIFHISYFLCDLAALVSSSCVTFEVFPLASCTGLGVGERETVRLLLLAGLLVGLTRVEDSFRLTSP